MTDESQATFPDIQAAIDFVWAMGRDRYVLVLVDSDATDMKAMEITNDRS